MEIIISVIVGCICLIESSILIIVLLKKRRKQKNLKNQINYIAKITHDLRTPIYAIDGFTLLASRTLNQPEKLELYLDKIKRISQQMLALVNDSIDLSKIQNNKLEVSYENTNLEDCIHTVIENVEAQIENKNLAFEKKIYILHKIVKTDSKILFKILLNLLSNALKYTSSNGTIRFHVFEEEKSEKSSTYRFEIQDTGCGMSKSFQKCVFEPFAQEGKLEHTDVASSGLGMCIVKHLVESLHGKILLNSEQGIGTQISVLFDFEIVSN